MRCKDVSLHLSKALYGEHNRWAQWRIDQHLHHCPACSDEWRSLGQLHRLLSANDLVAPGLAVRPEPAESPPTTRRTYRQRALPLLAGAGLTSLCIVLLLTLPRFNRALSSAAQVGNALAHVNTWHLRGWKIVDGKQVGWEVWGQRAPFFYWERIGGQVIVDNGAHRTQIYPPDLAVCRKKGLILKTPSRQEANNVYWSYEHMVEQWQNHLRPWKQTPTDAVFNFNECNTFGYDTQADKLYVVDKQTLLPKSYEVRLHRQHQVRTIEYLQVEYDRALPTSVTGSREQPRDYLVVDATRQPIGKAVPSENVVTEDGLTVQMTPLAMDTQGNVLMDIRGWLGGLVMDGTNSLMLQVSAPLSERGGPPASYAYQDNMGRRYILVLGLQVPGLGVVEKSAYHFVFSPVEMRPEGSLLPDTLTVRMSFGPSVAVRTSGVRNTIMPKLLFEKDLTFTLALPKKTEVIDPIRYVAASGSHRVISIDSWENLSAHIEWSRSNYYGSRGLNARPVNRADIALSAEWMEAAIAASTTTFEVQSNRVDLAEKYRILGNKPRARRLLRQVLSAIPFLKFAEPASPVTEETRHILDEGGRGQRRILRREAEAALHRIEAGYR